jgi:hypothetical protein
VSPENETLLVAIIDQFKDHKVDYNLVIALGVPTLGAAAKKW